MTKSSKGGKGDVGWAKLKNAIHFGIHFMTQFNSFLNPKELEN